MSEQTRTIKILLIAGGWSSEREVSLRGAAEIAKALEGRGYQVRRFDLNDGFSAMLDLCAEHDLAFINLHGAPGEDGLVQALLDRAGLPHQGSGPVGSFLALHKDAAKSLFRRAGLLTPDWVFLPKAPAKDWQPELTWPLFVKPNTGGSSVHTFQAQNGEQLDEALAFLFGLGKEVLVEQKIDGQELTCGVLEMEDGKNLGLEPVLIRPKQVFFNFQDKYDQSGADEICPAPVPEKIRERIKAIALTAHQLLGLRGYSRTDVILTEDQRLFVLETNTLPGMTPTSLFPQEAKAAGLEFTDLLEHLLHNARNGSSLTASPS